MRGIAVGVVYLLSSTIAGAQGYLGTIGFNDLQNRLGVANTPNGLGVRVAQVEAFEGAAYSSNPNLASGRPGFTMTFNGTTTNPNLFSGHANFVANYFWANGTMATGVTEVDSWDASTWINTLLDGNGSGLPPSTYAAKVSNHSYIGSAGSTNDLILARRADYLVDRSGHIMVVGGGNNGATAPAPLFGHSYNTIAVGRSDGNGGGGFTTFDTPGRVKPDLVAPTTSVSGATPMVASAATLLVQTAGATPDAARPQVIKSVLMTGATKNTLTSWGHTATTPLDPKFGAGMLNINRAHQILTAGQQDANSSATVTSTGWDFNSINTSAGASQRRYFFDVVPAQNDISFTATVTWHREFVEGDPFNFTFADLNLRLYASNSSFDLLGAPLEESRSTVDNVEHLFRAANMPLGRYALVVEANGLALTDYAVAWQFIPVPEPTSGVLVALSAFFVLGYARCRKCKSVSIIGQCSPPAQTDPEPGQTTV